MWFVYVDYRCDTNLPFYVGMGDAIRVASMQRNRYHRSVLRKFGINRKIVLSTRDRSFAIEQEVKLIDELKTRDFLGGANFTDGGEGTPGRKMSQLGRKNISLFALSNWKNNRDEMMKRLFSSEVHERRVASLRKTTQTDSYKEKQRLHTLNNLTPLNRKNRSEGQKNRNSIIENRFFKSRAVKQIDLLTGETVAVFYSTKEAERQTGVLQGNISRTARNRHGTAGGFCWVFAIYDKD